MNIILQTTIACLLSAFTVWWFMGQALTIYPPSQPNLTPADILGGTE